MGGWLSSAIMSALAALQLKYPKLVNGNTYTNKCHQCSVQINRTKGFSESNYAMPSDTLLCITNYQVELDEMLKRPNVNYSCPSYNDRCAIRFREMPGNRYRFSRICLNKDTNAGYPKHSMQCSKSPYYDPRVPKSAIEHYGMDLICWCRNRKDFCNNWAFDSVFVQYWAQYVALAPARPDNPVTKKVYREPDGSYTQAPTTVLPVTSTEQPDDQDILTVTGKYTLGTFYKALDAERGKTAVSVTTNAPTGSPTIKSSSERRTAALLFLVLACFLSLLGWLE